MSDLPSTPTPVLLAEGLQKHYRIGRDPLKVLQDVSLQLHAGEVTALMGSSGSGKSTLLHLLGLMDQPDQGRILLRGREIQGRRASTSARIRAQEIGFVFQQFQLIHELRAIDNVLLPRRVACGWSWFARRKQERTRAEELLREVGLGERLRHRPSQLSGGEQQRVAIARAMISRPPVLLADEPSGNLDRQTGEEILELLLGLARERGSALLLATHDRSIADACDRLVVLEDGVLKDG